MIDLWKTKDLQHLLALLIHLEGQGVTDLAGVKDRLQRGIDTRMLDTRRSHSRAKRQNRQIREALRCSQCGEYAVRVSPVNVSASTMVDGGWRSVVTCTNPMCWHQEFSLLEPMAIIKLLAGSAGK